MIWFFLISGLFLGWSLGANDASNAFGTAVGTGMVRFKTAALVASIFVILGAVIEGAGPTKTLNELGAVNAMAGSFTVALSAAMSVTLMTRSKLPVSTSQSIIGAIIGWNLFTGSSTDLGLLGKIVSTWIFSPVLAAAFAFVIFYIFQKTLWKLNIHMLRQDAYNRFALLLVGAFGAYSLGANNIANVMGVFVTVSPFNDLNVFGLGTISGQQVLFLVGALAIAVGVCTYSERVMRTVGNDLFKLTPVAALIVVLAESLVLYIFASQGLKNLLKEIGLPSIPLVPVSSSQAVIGAIIGIAIAKGGKGINYKILRRISIGWVVTPILAGLICFVSLFIMQNVFEQPVASASGSGISSGSTNHSRHPRNTPDTISESLRDIQ
jgi:PiT family inorganic phosphate transporter